MNLELSEVILRIILICITLVYFVIQIIFNRRFLPELTVTSVPLRSEIIFILLNILWPSSIILLLFSGFAYFELPDIIQYFGILLYVLGIALYTWANITLGKNLSADLQIRKGHQLVDNGPYRKMRHPIYAAWLVCGLGILLLSANWLITLLYFIPVTARILLRLKPEEKMLSDHFGQKYINYEKRTSPLFPK